MQKYQLKRAEIGGEEDSATTNQHCPLQQTSPLQTGTKREPRDRACWETPPNERTFPQSLGTKYQEHVAVSVI